MKKVYQDACKKIVADSIATQEQVESARHAPQQPQYEICQTCGGEGSLYDYTDDEVVECHVCKGTGKHRTVR